jgi:hypothetical protein
VDLKEQKKVLLLLHKQQPNKLFAPQWTKGFVKQLSLCEVLDLVVKLRFVLYKLLGLASH